MDTPPYFGGQVVHVMIKLLCHSKIKKLVNHSYMSKVQITMKYLILGFFKKKKLV